MDDPHQRHLVVSHPQAHPSIAPPPKSAPAARAEPEQHILASKRVPVVPACCSNSPSLDRRKAELINATTKDQLATYVDDLIPAIQQAIIDDVDTVRSSASLVVALLHNNVGPKATADIVSWVLAQLQDVEDEDHGHLFLNGMEQLMAKQPGAVLPLVLAGLATEPEDV